MIDGLELPPDPSILEVGCGTGGNLAMLSRFGTLSAMELDDSARRMATDRGVVEVQAGRLPDQIPSDGPFDLIVALDVIEHVADDVAAVNALRSRLTPRGRLLVTVPAFMFLWSEHDEINHHFRRYRRAGLTDVLVRSGLSVDHMTYFNTALFPLVAIPRLVERMRPPTPEASGGELVVPGRTVNRVLESVFAAERKPASRFRLPFGVSLLAVGQQAEVVSAQAGDRSTPTSGHSHQ